MASNFYNNGLLKLLNGDINYISDDISLLVVDNTYTFDRTDEFVSDITGEVSGSGYSRLSLAGKTLSLNASTNTVVFDCDDLTMNVVSTSNAFSGAVIYGNTGVDSTSPLIGFFDMPETSTNGSDVTLTVAAAGLFQVSNNIV
jgi:hypothetical protein